MDGDASARADTAEGVRSSVTLSARQSECLYWVQEGKSSPDIGVILGISARTVEQYIEQACLKLGVRRRIQAVVVARSLGLIGSAPP